MTLTNISWAKAISITFWVALIPAISESNKIVIELVNLFINLICSVVVAVPDDATTLDIPLWCKAITSKYPSTK